MVEWERVAIGELVEDGEVSYGIVQPGQNCPEGVPIVRVSDIRNGVIDTTNPLKTDPAIAGRFRRTALRGGELLVSIVGTVGEVAVASPALAGWNVARAVAVVRPVEASAIWLRYCFLTDEVRNQLNGSLNTTVQATLNLKDLKALRVPLPPEEVRTAIAEVLGVLDDKIAANERTISLSADLATSFWRSATENVEHELTPLSSLARFVNGRAYTKNATGTGRVVIRIAELNSGIGRSTVYNDIEVPDDNVARPGDLLFAWSGSLTVARWHRPEAVVNQHIFKVIPVNGRPQWLVEHALRDKLEEFRAVAADKATTMGHIQRRHLDEPVKIPHQNRIDSVGPPIEALLDQISSLHMENLALAHTRDQLLPLLMSGKVTVRDIEGDIEDIV